MKGPDNTASPGDVKHPDMLVYYNFQEQKSKGFLKNASVNKTLNKQSALALNGEVFGARWGEGSSPGRKALHFNGSSDFVRICPAETLNNLFSSGAGTVCIRFKAENHGFIFQYFSNHSDRLYLRKEDELDELLLGIAYRNVLGKEKLSVDQWHFFAVSWKIDAGEMSVNMYMDGTLDAKASFPCDSFRFYGSEFFYLGRGHAGNPCFFKGAIDGFAAFNQALPADEIEKIRKHL
jgi:hypothetical protein